MLFRRRFLAGIREGKVSLAYRRWRRPTVKSGGTLLTAIGELEIVDVSIVPPGRITSNDALRAGYESLDDLLSELNDREDGDVYRIELGRVRADPRVALRAAPVSSAKERDQILRKLERLDARGGTPWTARVLRLIESNPGVRAADLCKLARQEKDEFKTNVRKLKGLGLTESLETGYRLSARGSALLPYLT